jgi:hypothetical protein
MNGFSSNTFAPRNSTKKLLEGDVKYLYQLTENVRMSNLGPYLKAVTT